MGIAVRFVEPVKGKWVVRRSQSGPVIGTYATRVAAVEAARAGLKELRHGGDLVTMTAGGRVTRVRIPAQTRAASHLALPFIPRRYADVLSRRPGLGLSIERASAAEVDVSIAPPDPSESLPPNGLSSGDLLATVRQSYETTLRQGKKINSVSSAALRVTSALTVPAGGAVSASLNSDVAALMSGGWWSVFLNTINWSLAVALFLAVYLTGRTSPPAMIAAFVGSVTVAGLVAGFLGKTFVTPADVPGASGPQGEAVNFVTGALRTFGPEGFTLGLVIGCWLGYVWSPVLRRVLGDK